MSNCTTIVAYWVLEQGRRQSVCTSKAEALREIDALRSDEDRESGSWTVECETVDVPVVEVTSLFDSPEGAIHHWHAEWACPHCSGEHVTDIDSPDAARELWLCERGLGLVFVQWPRQSLGT